MYLNLSSIPERKKYRLLNPKIEKILELKIMNESSVILKIAGIESTANRISVNSTTISAANKGVATFFPFTFSRKCPCAIDQSIG